MKKTLIALAVLAASGASFAQVTITGGVAFGYRATNTASGFGIDDSSVKFSASEDLGGGTKVATSFGISNTNRKEIKGGDFALGVSGGFGSVDFSLAEGSDWLSGDFVGLDGKVFSALDPATDGASYSTPSFGGFKATLAHSENDNSYGTGAAGHAGQRHNTLSVSYSGGPLSASLGLRAYDNQGLSATASKNRVRAKASYDFGVAKLGAGVITTDRVDQVLTDSNIGVTVPFGSLTFAADFGNRKLSNDGTRSGYGLTAAYALSKRTAITAKYYSWEGTIGGERLTQSDLLLSHSF